MDILTIEKEQYVDPCPFHQSDLPPLSFALIKKIWKSGLCPVRTCGWPTSSKKSGPTMSNSINGSKDVVVSTDHMVLSSTSWDRIRFPPIMTLCHV